MTSESSVAEVVLAGTIVQQANLLPFSGSITWTLVLVLVAPLRCSSGRSSPSAPVGDRNCIGEMQCSELCCLGRVRGHFCFFHSPLGPQCGKSLGDGTKGKIGSGLWINLPGNPCVADDFASHELLGIAVEKLYLG